MLTLDGLMVSYAGIEAVRGVGLEVREGEMVALIGPNGAGKSTLLNAVSGLVRAARGSVRFAGGEICGLAAHRIARRGLLQVPEGRQILAQLSVRENLLLGALALGRRPARYGIAQVHATFPVLEERGGQAAGTLSGGEQQMLAIGRAMMGSPRLLLLDEPSLGLSPAMAQQVFATLRTLNEGGLTILLVEQDARRALAVTDRAYVIERGVIVRDGASAALAKDPRVIAHYLGHEPQQAERVREQATGRNA